MASSSVTELVGLQKCRNDLRMMAERMANPAVMLETQFSILEEAERMLFEAHGGEYVNTGRLMASLTQRGAEDAIRRNHGPAGIEFGTATWYAKFQKLIDGPSGKPRGRKRYGKNQILQLTPLVRRNAAAAIREYLYEGLGE